MLANSWSCPTVTDGLKVPDRFARAIVRHLMRCFSLDPAIGSSQILALVGPPGGGKTFQLTRILAQADIEIVQFGAAEVESLECEPASANTERVLQTCGNDHRARNASCISD
jgi:SpoVK/Ycf46/Vps4 family AAA+-type ATPase